MNKVRATIEHSQLHQVHWEDALHDAVYKYNLTYYHGLKGIPYTAWHGEPTQVRRLLAFGQLAYKPILKPHRPKLASRAAPVRYLYGLDDTHICVQHIVTRQYHKVRAIDLKPYHRHQDPCYNANVVFKAKKTETRHKRTRTLTDAVLFLTVVAPQSKTIPHPQKRFAKRENTQTHKNGQRPTMRNWTSWTRCKPSIRNGVQH